ncbi:unnamed protein product [Enterobius vermicularis]|uniref:MH2 domain-containing protein n=1 Tax=Enterobius vermicularis TaxID=51028 RepID=A0A0N4VL05_ENTVE|nr:unnamed protein product [Enterobius vermicularis]
MKMSPYVSRLCLNWACVYVQLLCTLIKYSLSYALDFILLQFSNVQIGDSSPYMQSTSSMYMDISPPYLAGPQRLPEGTQGPSTYTLYSNAVEQLTMQGQRRRSNSFTRNLLAFLRRQKVRSQPQSLPTEMGAMKAQQMRPQVGQPQSNGAWFLAYYYELNQQVTSAYEEVFQIGEPFVGCYDQVIVDGLCAPSEAGRFCLGAIQNVERNSQVDQARRQIGMLGNGVRIYRVGENVYAECLCEKIFVQSPLYALQAKDLPHTVYRVEQGATMEIFNSDFFLSLLQESAAKGYRAVQSLQSLCHMRISFIKGWGKDYRRQTITATPCWIDAQLKDPLGKLDKVLSQCGGPTGTVYSFT